MSVLKKSEPITIEIGHGTRGTASLFFERSNAMFEDPTKYRGCRFGSQAVTADRRAFGNHVFSEQQMPAS